MARTLPFSRWSLLPLLPLLAACGTEVPANGGPAEPAGEQVAAAAPVAPFAPLATLVVPAPAVVPPVKPGAPGLRMHTELVTGVRFPVPRAGILVEERHFDPGLPSYKFRHSISIKADGSTRVLVDVWDNPGGLALNAWFGEHLGFLVRDVTQVSERPMTSGRIPGILLREPASEQAASQIIAVFAFRQQVFRVTGLEPDEDAASREMFDRVLDQIELGVTQ